MLIWNTIVEPVRPTLAVRIVRAFRAWRRERARRQLGGLTIRKD